MSGNQKRDSIPIYPENSIQNLVNPWWEEDNAPEIQPGRLIMSFLPHIDQQPYVIRPIGRQEATRHKDIVVRIEALNVNCPQKRTELPVAAMPSYGNGITAAYRTKKRPAVVICCGGKMVDDKLRRGKPKWQTAPTIIVAPFYGADEDGSRAGFPKALTRRIQFCEYPQYILDYLPVSGSSESILRLDHMQPIGFHYSSLELLRWRLSDDAISVIHEWIEWLFQGSISNDGVLKQVIEYFQAEHKAGC